MAGHFSLARYRAWRVLLSHTALALQARGCLYEPLPLVVEERWTGGVMILAQC